MFDIDTLYASVLWSGIGSGFFIYGKKQGNAPALVCGCALFAISFFVYAPLTLSLLSIGIIAASVMAMKMGY
jgi:hypothetical protein